MALARETPNGALAQRVPRLPTRTPAPRRAQETPFGKILPVFEGFDLAETSDWLEPPTPGPSSLGNVTLRTPGRRRTQLLYPTLPELPDSSIDDSSREPSQSLVHENDMFSRRITDSSRRKSRALLPTDVVPTPRSLEPRETSRPTRVSRSRSRSPSLAERHDATPRDLLVPRAVATEELESIKTPNAPPLPRMREGIKGTPTEQRVDDLSPRPPNTARSSSHTLNKSSVQFRPPLGATRTVVAIGSGGRTLTRAERAQAAGSTTTLRAGKHDESRSHFTPREKPPSVPKPVPVTVITAPLPERPSYEVALSLPSHDVAQLLPASAPADISTVSANVPSASPSPPAMTETPLDIGITPRRYASPALSEDTLNGTPAHWDVSMAASASSNVSIISLPERTRRESDLPVHKHKLLSTPASSGSTTPARSHTPSADTSTSSVRRMSGGVLGFISNLLGGSPAVASPQPPSSQIEVQQETVLPSGEGKVAKSTPRKAKVIQEKRQPRPQAARRPVEVTVDRPALAPTKSVNLPNARSAPQFKRKAPSSPQKPTSTALPHKRRAPPSPVKPSRPVARTQPAATNSFAAQALARLPKPGQGHTATIAKTTIRDAERARDLAVRRAVFERVGKAVETKTQALPQPRVTQPIRGNTPGAASRRRAQERAAFDAQVAARAAARAATQAEQDRIRADIEAELDRQARHANVIRARPLPAMYQRRL